MGVSGEEPERNRGFRCEHGLPFKVLSDSERKLADALNVPTTMYHPIRLGLPAEYPKGVSTTAAFIFDAEGNRLSEWVQTPTVTNYYGSAGRISVQEVVDRLREIVSRGGDAGDRWGAGHAKHRPDAEDIKQHPSFLAFEIVNRRLEYLRSVVLPWLTRVGLDAYRRALQLIARAKR